MLFGVIWMANKVPFISFRTYAPAVTRFGIKTWFVKERPSIISTYIRPRSYYMVLEATIASRAFIVVLKLSRG